MKFIHSEVPELSEEILPRSTQEENEIPLQDITIESVKDLSSIPIYSEEELIQYPSLESKKLNCNQKKILKLIRLLVKDVINFIVVGMITYLVFNFLKRNKILN